VYNPNEAPSPNPAAPPATGAGGAPNARYAYLVGRLRNRQITMEEATELFGIMQAMLRSAETARQLAIRAIQVAPPPPPVGGPTAPPPTPVRALANTSDDFLLMGILAMGAGAGLLAALTKRIQEGPVPPSGSTSSSPGARSP
jgi:hypothetical protein